MSKRNKKRYRIVAKCYDKRGRLISKGENSYDTSHPIQAHFARLVGQKERIFLHAEIQAIIRARGKVIQSIRVERYDSKGNERLALPCAICKRAIADAGIKEITYTTGA